MLLGHAVLVLILCEARRPTFVGEPRQAVALRLVPPSPRPRSERAQTALPVAAPVGIRLIAPPDFVVGAVDHPGHTGTGEAMGAAQSPGAPASGAGALNLKPSAEILRGALTNPATTDPRSNSPKPTFEERIAMGLNPDLCVKFERDAEGVVHRRMGRMARTLTHLQATQGVGAKDVRTCE